MVGQRSQGAAEGVDQGKATKKTEEGRQADLTRRARSRTVTCYRGIIHQQPPPATLRIDRGR
jgi:hypothetical protein